MIKSLIITLFCTALVSAAVDFTVTPEHPATMSVTVSAGSATLPGGATVTFNETVLTCDGPEIVTDSLLSYYVGWNRRDEVQTALAPDNYATWWEPWQPWPAQGNPVMCKPRAINPGNNYDGILGGLYRAVIPESLIVMNADRTDTFELGTDYRFNPEFGQIGNLGGALGTPKTDNIRITYDYVPQRYDLIQVDASGTVSIKKGNSVAVCPTLPEPDADHTALAGIYIARYDSFSVDVSDINIIDPVTVAPVNAAFLSGAKSKLDAGDALKMTFFGASVTDGAEAGAWWNSNAPLTYRQQVVDSLNAWYPAATVSEVAPEAHVGGNTIDDGIPLYTQHIKPASPDVLVVMFGLNDCDGSQTGSAKNPVASYKEDLRGVVQTAQADGSEVLIIAAFNLHPFYIGSTRFPEYRQAMLDVADEEGAALADVYTKWENLRHQGMVPHSQLHNNKNHPGVFGHALIADAILECIEAAPVSSIGIPTAGDVMRKTETNVLYTLDGHTVNPTNTKAGVYLRHTADGITKTVVIP